jgi:hypothetical protein
MLGHRGIGRSVTAPKQSALGRWLFSSSTTRLSFFQPPRDTQLEANHAAGWLELGDVDTSSKKSTIQLGLSSLCGEHGDVHARSFAIPVSPLIGQTAKDRLYEMHIWPNFFQRRPRPFGPASQLGIGR